MTEQTAEMPAFLDSVGQAYYRTFLSTVQPKPDQVYGLQLMAYLCQRCVRHEENVAEREEFRAMADEFYPPRKKRRRRGAKDV